MPLTFASLCLYSREMSEQKGKDMTSSEAERIIRLEETVAHQARIIEDLSAELAKQWTSVAQMRAKLDRLTERFLTLEEQTLDAPAITRPPHY